MNLYLSEQLLRRPISRRRRAELRRKLCADVRWRTRLLYEPPELPIDPISALIQLFTATATDSEWRATITSHVRSTSRALYALAVACGADDPQRVAR